MIKKQTNEFIIRFFICICLIALPILYVALFARHHQFFAAGDFMFQANRMEELYNDVLHGIFIPRISTYTFNQVGSGINFFYPWIMLYPFVLFRFITHNPVTAMYLFILFYTYVTVFISYFCMKSYSFSRSRSFFFAILYTFANYRLYLVFNQNVLAESIAYCFLPLVFLGFFEICYRNHNKWPLLGFGMSLILLSHMLTTALSALLMIVIFLLSMPYIKNIFQRLLSGIKAVILSVCLTAFYLVPFFYQSISNHVRGSWTGLEIVASPAKLIHGCINNDPQQYVGMLLLLTLFFGPLYLKKAKMTEQWIYFIGLILVISTTTIIPWKHLNITPFNIIQFPYRLNGLATLMLTTYLSFILYCWWQHLKGKKYMELFMIIAFVGFTMLLNVSAEFTIIDSRAMSPRMNKLQTVKNYIPNKSNSFNLMPTDWHYMFNYFGNNGSFDYFPKALYGKSQYHVVIHDAKIKGHWVNFNKRIHSKPNELIYDLTGISDGTKVVMPTIYYTNDLVKIGISNYKKPNVNSKHQITVKVPKRHKIVRVKYHNSLLDEITILISAFSWLFTLITLAIKKINRSNI